MAKTAFRSVVVLLLRSAETLWAETHIDGNTAAGILLFQAAAGVQVTGNTLTGNDIDGLSSDGSTNAVLSGNTPSGNTDAIQLDDDATGSTIQNNLISSNTGTGVYIDGSVTDSSAPLTVNNNSIFRQCHRRAGQ